MKTKTFALFALVVLISQPLIITASFGFDSDSVAERTAPVVLAQEPGTRQTGSDLSNHIPIFINGTTDFVSQGWPGAGTIGNPYVISALNITYGIGDPCIWIINTTQYFVIQDCFIHQLSAEYAIHLENVTHGVIEYSTLESGYGGLLCLNANSTKVSDTLIETVTNYGLFVSHSESFEMADSSVSTTQSHAAYLEYSNLSSISGVTIESSGAYIDLEVSNSDFVSVTNTDFHIAAMDLFVYQCANFTGNGLVSLSAQVGIYLYQCNGSQIVNADVMSQYDALDISDCRGLEVTNSKFSSPTYSGQVVYAMSSDAVVFDEVLVNDTLGNGMYVLQSNITVLDSSFSNIGSNGLYLENSNDSSIQGCNFDNIGSDGLYLDGSHRAGISDCFFTNAGNGVYGFSSANGTLHQNTVSDVSFGASLDNCYAWEIDSNSMHDLTAGILVTGSSHDDIWNNDISKASDVGIEAENHGVIEIWENAISESNGGILLLNCNDQYIRNNTVTMCEVGGLLIRGTVDSEISTNTISDCAQVGISLENFNTSSLIGNSVSRCPFAGILYQSGNYSTLQDNNLVDCGLFLFAQLPIMSPAISDYNHSLSGNTVNGKPLYYAINKSALSIDGNSYGEIITVNCSEVTIAGGQFVSSTCAVEILFSNNVRITNIECEELTMPIFGLVCENVTIADSTISGTNEQNGAYLYSCVNTRLENISFEGVGGALPGQKFALGVMGFYNLSIVDCEFTDILGIAIGIFAQVSMGSFGVVSGCSIANATYGIVGYSVDALNITDNEFKWCDTGIFLTGCSTTEITWNNIHDNTEGIYCENNGDSIIANNTVRWNQIGVELIEQNSPLVVADNIIALNLMENGADNTLEYWDNGVDTGNYWNDYSGTGVYTVSGVGGAQDRYPKKYTADMPIINTPEDVWYAEGSTGNQIVWLPFDNELRNWQVKVDGQAWASESWNFQNVTVNIDGLAYGTHTVVITVWDVDQNSVTDTVIVHVYDDLSPVLKSPPNQLLFVDATGQTIDWQASDLHPATYALAVDGTEFASGTWTSGTLAVNVDGINDMGQHTLLLIIYDIDGNSANGTVLVRVIDDNVSPTIDHPEAVTYIEGTTGNSIVWNPADQYPASFAVVSNDTTVASGSWSGSRILLNVDGLAPGYHQYTLTVYDMSGNSATSAVNVTVLSLIPTVPAGEIDWALVAIVGAVVGGAAVLVVVIYYLRKRR